jgi:acyl-CoA-binding protein
MAAKKAPAAKAAAAAGGDLDAKFEAAQGRAKQLKERPDNDTLLRLYALYKQGSEGDVHGDKPGFFDFVATAKYDAWSKLKGTSQADAKKKYVELVDKLSR